MKESFETNSNAEAASEGASANNNMAPTPETVREGVSPPPERSVAAPSTANEAEAERDPAPSPSESGAGSISHTAAPGTEHEQEFCSPGEGPSSERSVTTPDSNSSDDDSAVDCLVGKIDIQEALERAEADTSPPSSTELSSQDIQYLQEREKIIRSHGKSQIAVAKALNDIHSYEGGCLWRDTHETFGGYCREKWGYSKSHSYRLVEMGRFAQKLRDHGGIPNPTSENQIRFLVSQVPEAHQIDCWKQIVANFKLVEISGEVARQEVCYYLREQKLWKPKVVANKNQRAISEVEKLRKILGKLADPKRFEQILKDLTALIEAPIPT